MIADCRLPIAELRRVSLAVFHSAIGIRQSAIIAAAMVIGCESTATTQPSESVRSRQDSAMKDPFSYGPDAHDPKKAPQGLDKNHPGDGTAKSEWDRFWNP